MQKQIRERGWRQSWGKWIPETDRRETRRERNRFQGKLFFHWPWRCRPNCQLGCRWKRIPSHRWSSSYPTTHARTCCQTFGWLESRRCSVNCSLFPLSYSKTQHTDKLAGYESLFLAMISAVVGPPEFTLQTNKKIKCFQWKPFLRIITSTFISDTTVQAFLLYIHHGMENETRNNDIPIIHSSAKMTIGRMGCVLSFQRLEEN